MLKNELNMNINYRKDEIITLKNQLEVYVQLVRDNEKFKASIIAIRDALKAIRE
jgi:hypothetical protein